MGKKGRVLGWVVIGLLLCLPVSEAKATVHQFACGGGSTIQSYINNPAVVSGDTIKVTGGQCNENVDVNKSGLTIDGSNAAIINGTDSNQPTVKIRVGGTTVRNFLSIQGGDHGISIQTCSPTIYI